MPTYEYECKCCEHSFESFQSMSDAPLSECPLCKKELRRLINGGSGVIFKGSGFYITDKNKDISKKPSTASTEYEGKGESVQKDRAKSGAPGDSGAPCASCPAAGGVPGNSCPASEKAAG